MQCNCPINKLLSQGCKCGAFLADQNKLTMTHPPFTWGIVLSNNLVTTSLSLIELTSLTLNYTFTKKFTLDLKLEVQGEGHITIARDGVALAGSFFIAPLPIKDSIRVIVDASQLPVVCNKISVHWAALNGVFNLRNSELIVSGS